MPDQIAQVGRKQRRGRITAGHARCKEILRSAGTVVILAIHHRQHMILVADVSQHTLFGNADLIGHILHGDAVVSTFADQLHRRIQHFLTALFRRFAHAPHNLFFNHDFESSADAASFPLFRVNHHHNEPTFRNRQGAAMNNPIINEQVIRMSFRAQEKLRSVMSASSASLPVLAVAS